MVGDWVKSCHMIQFPSVFHLPRKSSVKLTLLANAFGVNLFSKYYLHLYVPGIVLGAREIAMNKTKVSAIMAFTSVVEGNNTK